MKKTLLKKEYRGRVRSGFTLIELLISIVIFMLFIGIASTSYVSIVRAQRQANEVRRMYSDVRTFMDFLAEEIRLSAVDYSCYNPDLTLSLTQPECPDNSVAGSIVNGRTKILALVRKGGTEKTIFKLDADNLLKMQKFVKKGNVWGPAPGYEEYRPLLSERLEVKNITFAVFPEVNPYSGDSRIYTDNTTQFQPKVTIFFGVKNSENVSTPFDYDFQTTVSSRVYSRIL